MNDKAAVKEVASEKQDANSYIALGAGVGAFGVASAVTIGVVCPLCYFIAPGLVGYGAYKRWRVSQAQNKEENHDKS